MLYLGKGVNAPMVNLYSKYFTGTIFVGAMPWGRPKGWGPEEGKVKGNSSIKSHKLSHTSHKSYKATAFFSGKMRRARSR